ncbi:MAG: UvrD-helicase domain-containing protein [Patescibacteria group bacterium]
MSMEFSLNQAQERAVLTADGPVLIVAGAGSGKTMVLAHRIAHLIEKGVKAEQILAITFTNKAAEEMRSRISKLLNLKAGIRNKTNPWVGTFHSFSAFVLRQSGRAIGVGKTFSILDEEDSLALIKEALADLELDPKKFEARKIRALISRKKNEMEGRENLNRGYFEKILAQAWEKYEEKLEKTKALDFDDLLLKTVELFSKHPQILDEWQERFRYLHVDEYQDTNLVQYHLAKLLAQKYENICVVGDIDQAIYSWRGADFRNILHFERDWPEAKIITLEENYRSTQLILDAANAVIVKNKSRVPKNLFSQKKSGPKITLFESISGEEEAGFVAALSKTIIRDGKIPPREIAVLYRTNFQSRILEEKMLEENIPYQVVGVKFYERKEIKDTLAYLKASLNSEDLLSVKRIINFPPRGIGKALLTKFLAGEKLDAVEEFKKILAEIKNEIETKKTSEAVKSVIKKSGLEDYLEDGTEEGEMRLANVRELVTLAKHYDEMPGPEGILKLLEDAALMSEQDTMKKEENSVKLMTVHAAKGLEFKAVFIAGLEEGLFPHRALSNEEEELRGEEERRLFYVALTRAKEKIFLSYAVFRTIFGERRINLPSNFLSDIPEEFLERSPEKIITLES